jgi:hypothetical protein
MTTTELRGLLLSMRDLGEQHNATRVTIEHDGEVLTYRIGAGAVLTVNGERTDIPEAWIDAVGLVAA